MTTAWIEGAHVIEAVDNGGTMTGNDHYATWHSTENNPLTTTAANIARFLNQTRNCVHVLWNGSSGEIVVTLPPSVAGRGLENPPGGVETNRNGKVNIQIEVVARAVDPFTGGPMKNRDKLLAALDKQGIPRKFPCGAPLPYPKSYGNNGQRHASAKGSGHVCHSQWEENVHGDPGAIDFNKLLDGTPTKPSKPPVVPPNHPNNKPGPSIHFVRENGDGLYERGEEGPGITTLQNALNKHGFNCGKADGFFGNSTLSAVKACQHAHHLTEDGIAGPNTLRVLGLAAHLAENSPGLKVDGAFGPATMRALQEAVGLTGKDVDGWYAYSAPYSYNLGATTTDMILRHLKSHDNVIKAIQHRVDVDADGKMGHDTIVALQRALNAGKF